MYYKLGKQTKKKSKLRYLPAKDSYIQLAS